jgi:pyruvate dehydrogenase E1 component alpha subunit
MPGVVVDGMDVFAVYDAAGEAIARARAGEGPTFLEMKTYRYHGHFHADDASKYRKPEEEAFYKEKDAIKHFERTVTRQKLMTEKKMKSIRDVAEQEMLDAVDFALTSPMPEISTLYDDVYVNYSNPISGLR